jgi:nucleoside-diphosphate-sugar epimerase
VNYTRRYLAEHGVTAQVEFSWGATEVKVPDLVDAIVRVLDRPEPTRRRALNVAGPVPLSQRELTEAITLKQLGLYKGPVIILNTLDYYRSFIEFLDHMITGHFLRTEHKGIWVVVKTPEETLKALSGYEGWIEDPRRIARIF